MTDEPIQTISGIENRGAERFLLMMRPAKVVMPQGEFLCILKDVSATGVRLRLFHPLPLGQRVMLELSNGDRFEAEKVWEREDQAGLRFVEEADVQMLLGERARYPKRQIRVRLELPAKLTVAGEAHNATLHDLSQQGGRIESPVPLAIDQRVHLEVPGLPPIDAKVRWRRPPEAGLIFEQTFKLDELARILVRLQRGGQRGAADVRPVASGLRRA